MHRERVELVVMTSCTCHRSSEKDACCRIDLLIHEVRVKLRAVLLVERAPALEVVVVPGHLFEPLFVHFDIKIFGIAVIGDTRSDDKSRIMDLAACIYALVGTTYHHIAWDNFRIDSPIDSSPI